MRRSTRKVRNPTIESSAHGASPAARTLPRDLKSVCSLIAERRPNLPKRLMQVADFAVSHPQEIAFETLASIAKLAKVQPSTLVRFAGVLGYDGFSDLQTVFRDHARQRWPDYRERLASLRGQDGNDGDPFVQLQRFASAAAASVDRIMHTVDPAALLQAVNILARADTIYLAATRRALAVTTYLAYSLRNLDVRCELTDQGGGLVQEQIKLMSKRDVLLAVSFSPYAPVTLECATLAHGRGLRVIGITDTLSSPLARLSEVCLEVVEADHAGFRSLCGAVTLALTLAVSIGRRRSEPA